MATGVADQTQLVIEDFDEEVTDVAGAVLVAGEDLFVGVAPDLWRTQDEDGERIGRQNHVYIQWLRGARGFRRTRHVGAGDGSRRAHLLGHRRYWF